MKHEIKAPSVGESITEVRIANWKKASGEAVKQGEVILEIESDKATVEVISDHAGALSIAHGPGETVKVGEVLGFVDDEAKGSAGVVKSASTSTTVAAGASSAAIASAASVAPSGRGATSAGSASLAPSVRRMVEEENLDPSKIAGTGKGGRITKGDVIDHKEGKASAPSAPRTTPAPQSTTSADGRERRVPMSLLRQRIAERLVSAQHTAAILTTFNEVDMGAVMDIRARHKESFKAKNGVPLSFMSFFTRAVVEGLKAIPAVNAMIDGKEIVYRDYYDVGIAVGTERGLVVPVLRDVGSKGFVDIEKLLAAMAERARTGKLSIQELTGGTFTISNGGTYGSLLSTPILNPPQSGILGMHKIQERPMAVNGQVVVRPMMYLALSYDHRIIDGKEAVTFLIKVKEGIENPKLLGWEE